MVASAPIAESADSCPGHRVGSLPVGESADSCHGRLFWGMKHGAYNDKRGARERVISCATSEYRDYTHSYNV